MKMTNNKYSKNNLEGSISSSFRVQGCAVLFLFAFLFTLGFNANAQNPGGVSNNLYLWLRADTGAFIDAGITPVSDGQEVQELHDQGTNSFDLNDAGATGPNYVENAINFNPALDFSPNQDLHHAAGILKGNTFNNVYVYGVSTTNNAGLNNTFFYENALGSNYFKL